MKLDVSTREGYIIATALAGPGLPLNTLKRIVTGRIRHAAGVSPDHCIVRGRPMTQAESARVVHELCQLFPEPSINTDIIARALYHWAQHAHTAVGFLGLAYLRPLLKGVMAFAEMAIESLDLFSFGHEPSNSGRLARKIREALDKIYVHELEQRVAKEMDD